MCIRDSSSVAKDVGLDCLYEIHSLPELDKLSRCNPKLVGINQRNLQTFEVDAEHALALCQSLDDAVAKVAESGIETPNQAQLLAEGGFNAVLIGESIATASDPDTTLRSFTSIKI